LHLKLKKNGLSKKQKKGETLYGCVINDVGELQLLLVAMDTGDALEDSSPSRSGVIR
jgi:hypothetical protein